MPAVSMITRPPAVSVPCSKLKVPVTVTAEPLGRVRRPSPRMVRVVRVRLSAKLKVEALMLTVASCGATPTPRDMVVLVRLRAVASNDVPWAIVCVPPTNEIPPAPVMVPASEVVWLNCRVPASTCTVPVVAKNIGLLTTVVVPAPRLMKVPVFSIR